MSQGPPQGPIFAIQPDSGDYVDQNGIFIPKPKPVSMLDYYNTFITSPLTYNWISTPSKPKAAKPDEVDTTRSEPFVGWKTLSIHVTKKGKLRLLGAGYTKYDVDATAKCTYGHNHASPDWDCTCGFYALSAKPTTAECGWFLANVELFGTVIEGEHGWRASRQRVLSMSAFRECQAKDGECGKKAKGFQVGQSGRVWPVCEKHAPLGYSTLNELTGALGTEVSWLSR